MDQDDRSNEPLAPTGTPSYRVPTDFEPDEPARPVEPAVLVVKERPSQGTALLLPPLLVVMLGAGFLAYRSSAKDWRGLASLFESRPDRTLLAKVDTPPKPVPGEAASPDPAPAPEPTAPAPEAPAPEPKAEAVAPPAVKPDDPVKTDIEAEAEKTREKIAELERLKEKEAKALAETEADRREAAGRAFRLPRFQLRGIPPEQIEKMLKNQRDQVAFAEKMMERQLREMAEMQRRFLRDGFDSPDPDWPPRFAIPMPRAEAPMLPRAGRPGAGDNGDRIIRTPDGGIARFRQFRGPNGLQRFEWRWDSGRPQGEARRFVPNDPAEDDVPPPPRPAAPRRRID